MPRILNDRQQGLAAGHKKTADAKGPGTSSSSSRFHHTTQANTYPMNKKKGGNLAAYITDYADSDSQTTADDDLQGSFSLRSSDFSTSDSLWRDHDGSATKVLVLVHSRDDDDELVDSRRMVATSEKDKKIIDGAAAAHAVHVDDGWGHFVELQQRVPECDHDSFISIKTRLTPIVSMRKKSSCNSTVLREREKKSQHLFGRSHLFGI
jgi:hypothetical protein